MSCYPSDEKSKKFKKNDNEYEIDRNKLEYISFLCEEDDINYFCSFNEEENVKSFKLKKDIFEDSYLKLLVENEKMEEDAPSCYFLSFLYNNFYLYYCDIIFHNKNKHVHTISHIERDINFFECKNMETKEKKKKRKKSEEISQNNLIYIKGDEEKYIYKKYNHNVYDQNNLYNLNELHKLDTQYNIDKLHFLTSHYLAYYKIQNSILQYYIPQFNINKITKFDKHIKDLNNNYDNSLKYNVCANTTTEQSHFLQVDHSPSCKKKKEKKKEKEKEKKIFNYHNQKYSKIKRNHSNKKKKQIKSSSLNISKLLFPFYDYTTSEESVMSFSKFLPEHKIARKKKKKKKKKKTNKQNNKQHHHDKPFKSKFQDKEENKHNSMLIFKEIINLCHENKIFTFKKKKKNKENDTKKKHTGVHPEQFIQSTDKEQYIKIGGKHNVDNKQSFDNKQKYIKTQRNLSTRSYINNSMDCLLKKNKIHNELQKDHIYNTSQGLLKKRSFRSCSDCVNKQEEYEKKKRTKKQNEFILNKNVIIKGKKEDVVSRPIVDMRTLKKKRNFEGSVKNELKNLSKDIFDEYKENQNIYKEKQKDILTKKKDIHFLNFMNIRKKKEDNILKMQILKGLNQTHYDPLYLEKMVTCKSGGIIYNQETKSKEDEKKKKKINLHKDEQKYKNQLKSIEQKMNKHFVFKNMSVFMLNFFSLYINGEYEEIIQLYKQEYFYINFYIFYIYIKSLIKLKKYDLCLKYIFDKNDDNMNGNNINGTKLNEYNINPFNKIILTFLNAVCLEKLNKLKLSITEYCKVVVHKMDDPIKDDNNRNYKNKYNDNCNYNYNYNYLYSDDGINIHPFILICLDKLIGTYQLKIHEENTLIKYVQLHYDFKKLFNFYICKVYTMDKIRKYDVKEYMNTHNDITFELINDPNSRKNNIYSIQINDKNFLHGNNKGKNQKDCNININIRRMKRNIEEPINCHNNMKGELQNGCYNPKGLIYNKIAFFDEKRKKQINKNKKKKKKKKYVYINMNNVLYYINKNGNQDNYDMVKSLYSDNYYFDDNQKEKEEEINKKDIILYLQNKDIHKYIQSNNNILDNNQFYYNYFLCDYIVRQGVYNNCCYKYTLKKITHFMNIAYTNRNILGTIKKLAIELKIIYEKCIGDYKTRGNDNKRSTYDNIHTYNNNNNKYIYNNYLYHSEPVTLIDLLCITYYCLKNYDYINCYYISKYTIKERKGYENDEAILLFITSITNLSSVFKSSQKKIKELFLLYNERVSHMTYKKKKYYYKEENYKYENDYIDYYIIGIIYFLNNNFNKSLLYFLRCIQLKSNFYMCYVYMLYLFLSSLIKERKKNYKKFLFFKCVKLQPHNIIPYVIYSSAVLAIYQRFKGDNKDIMSGHINDNINENINENIYENIYINKNTHIYNHTDDIIYNKPDGISNIIIKVEKIHFLRYILNKALKIENDNIFVCNEYFIYNFLRKEYLQCEIFLKKIIFLCKNKFFPNNINVISSILYNMSIYSYMYQKNIYESERYIILLLENNPFNIKALHILIHIFFIKKNKNWIHLFDYSIYLENFLLSIDNDILYYDHSKIIDKQTRTTYLYNNFFNQLIRTKQGSLFLYFVYSKFKKARKFDTFLKKYIKERKEQGYGIDWGGCERT
ncbi:conserved Plasmodium protein, unknown function [Plasmodium sp. DRC-Itaito]|nr:conserved Plasmodium protein, unknown function [Plasmodium sp. DRC-Itaito]